MKHYTYKMLTPLLGAVLLAGCGENGENQETANNAANNSPDNNTTGTIQSQNNNDENNNEDNTNEINGNNEVDEESEAAAQAEMNNTDGEFLGTILFYEDEDRLRVEADVENLEEGYHGFHIHEEAICEPDEDEPFSSAGGHYNPDGGNHAEHAGDMPSLYVNEDGTAKMSFKTDKFTADQILEDETVVIIHEDPDNFGHIPERYQSEESDEPGPDEETLDTGDSGARSACGVVEEG
ncbi:superoxide dismutase family protein [Salipaludibacillus aurantiacus]|uniref:Superoxide dismutase [Cu-Zn] n=1 Tax=Salipaludibacillus aurantiacus TaxID=1601833 RepID=A0A1H9V012_9BACI|nr:superoxide dismutase family protein [Salipaludibacillus aurantiacus]SES14901.1 superoxide dismutase, Cu-Zn family [Salipaludibacillus aurantiacus]